MRATTAAWIGGIVEAHGTITLVRRNRPRGGPYYAPYLAVTSTCVEFLERIVAEVGGYVSLNESSRKNGKWAPVHMWRPRADELRRILPAILPWLVAKRARAEILIEVLAAKDAYRESVEPGHQGSEHRDRMEALRDRMLTA